MTAATHHFSRRVVITLVSLGLVFGFAAGALAADARLSTADDSLEKAHALVQAAREVTGEFSEKDARTYNRILAKAQDDIDRARRHVADAIVFADETFGQGTP